MVRSARFLNGLVSHIEGLEPRLLLDSQPGTGWDGEAGGGGLLGSAGLFVENQGQWSDFGVRFGFDGAGVDLALGDSLIGLRLTWPADPLAGGGDLDTAGAGQPAWADLAIEFGTDRVVSPVGLERTEATFNYLVGGQDDWRPGVGAYTKVGYVGLYAGVDLEIASRGPAGLKYEFRVAPGADYRLIELTYRGADGLRLDAAGTLHIQTPLGELVDDAPLMYQEIGGRRMQVAGAFELIDADTCGFVLSGDYDPSVELLIDPDLAWASYFGGSGYDEANAIAADAAGNLYVTGRTDSSGWGTAGAADATYGGAYDAYVAKLSSAGSLLWCTYLGGTSYDAGYGIAVGADGGALVTGETASAGWASEGAYDTTLGGTKDVFVARLAPDGASLAYCTYLGGSSQDLGHGIAVDASGSAYLTGYTDSTDWAVAGSYDTTYNGNRDAFGAKLDPTGAQLVYCTYLGGLTYDAGYDIALDSSSNAYITGESASPGWATSGAYDTSQNGNADVFVARLGATGAQLGYCTFLGGASQDVGYAVAVDASGAAYVTGQTYSAGWATSGAYDATHNGNADAFVAKVAPAGDQLTWATYLGNGGGDLGYGVAVDSAGCAYVTGQTSSSGWATAGAHDTQYDGNGDAFVGKLSADGVHLLYATYLGGTDADSGNALVLDPAGAVCVAGKTASSDWASGGSYAGGTDLFVARVAVSELPADISLWDGVAEIVDGQVTPIQLGTSLWNGPGASRTFTIRNDGDLPLTLLTPFADTSHFVASDPGRTSLGPGESTTFTVTLKTDTAWTGSQTISIGSDDGDENPFEFVVAGTVSAPAAIAVGTVNVSADKPLQRVPIYATGNVPVAGFNLRAQIGDGPGGLAEPVITAVDFSGGMWDAHEVTVIGGPVAGSPQYAQASVVFTGAGQTASAAGLVATLIIDTTGFASDQVFELKLSTTGIGADSEFITVGGDTFIPTITNGTISLHEAQVVGRRVFYNHSWFDGKDVAATAGDDAAIIPGKQALLPGQTATWASYTNYSRGINGIMIDIDGLAGTVSAWDFGFRAGAGGDPSAWPVAAAPQTVSVRAGEGTGGSDRVTIIWADGAIVNQWLQVTVLPSAQTTGLGSGDVFYFGNAVGETGNSATDAMVSQADFNNVRDHPRNFMQRAALSESWDINRDSFVDGTDLVLVRDHATDAATALPLLTAPGVVILAAKPPAPSAPGASQPPVIAPAPMASVLSAASAQPAMTLLSTTSQASQPAMTLLTTGAQASESGAMLLSAGEEPVVVIGTVEVWARMPLQRIDLYATGSAEVTGFNLRAQIGDGPGGASEPTFTNADFGGGIWSAHATTTMGGPVGGAQQYTQASVVFTAGGDVAAAQGRLVSLVIDTTGFEPGRSFAMRVSASGIDADSAFILTGGDALAADITNGLILLTDEEQEDPPLHSVELTRKFKFTDADGQWVTVLFKGPGWGTLLFDLPFDEPAGALQDPRGIVLGDTTLKTSLSISTRGRGSGTSVGDITIHGAIGKLHAKTTDLAGDLTIDQAVRTLRLDDLLGGSSIAINAAGLAVDAKVKAAVRLDQAGPGVTLVSRNEALRSLWLGSWADSGHSIQAPSIASLKVMGAFGGDVHLTDSGGGYVLGKATIKGNLLAGTWDLDGSVASLRVLGESRAALRIGGDVRTLAAYSWAGGRIEAASVRSLKATGRRGDDAGDFLADLELAGSRESRTLRSASVRGDISGSWDITGDAGAIKIRGAGRNWNLRARGDVKLISAAALEQAELVVDDVLSSLRARQWTGGSLTAEALGTMKLTGGRGISGDLRDVELLAGPAADPAGIVVKKMSVKGSVQDTEMRIRGHAGTMVLGRLLDSQVLLGAQKLTGSIDDFAAEGSRFMLTNLTIRGVGDVDSVSYFEGSQVGAWQIKTLRFVGKPSQVSGLLESHELVNVVNEPKLAANDQFTIVIV